MIPIAKPLIGKEEKRAVIDVLNSGLIAQGKMVKQLEEDFANFIGTKYAVAVSSGTAALHLSLLALNLKPGDEIITTPFTFIASANCALYIGAKPVFVDIDENTFNIDPSLIEKKITKKTKAILPVHLYGLAANMKEIMRIARKHNLYVIEDACQAHGATINTKKVGTFGDLGCFSFYPTKNMTSGEGGMITTNNKLLAEKLKMLRSHGMKKRYYHDILGFNFRMTDIAAAIGIEQLKKIEDFNQKRIFNSLFLNKELDDVDGIITPSIPYNYTHVFHQYTIKITNKYPLKREQLIDKLNKEGIGSMIYYPVPVHKQKIYKSLGYKDQLDITEKVSKQVLSLPIHPSLKKNDLKKIISVIANP